MSMSGEVKWKTGQSPAFIRGGMILVDGLLLATDGSKKLYLIEPDPAGFKTLAIAGLDPKHYVEIPSPELDTETRHVVLAWNPRLLRIRGGAEKMALRQIVLISGS